MKIGHFLATAVLILMISASDAQTRVRGYVRKDGIYVVPHYRSTADNRFWNNWSTSGNINPYTGRLGTKSYPSHGYGSYRSNSNSGYSGYYSKSISQPATTNSYYDVDLELLKIQNEVRLARERALREAQLNEYIESERRRIAIQNEIRELEAKRDQLQARVLAQSAPQSTNSGQSPYVTGTTAPVTRKSTTHDLYIVDKMRTFIFPKPITHSEALSHQEDILAQLFPDHYKQYILHKAASERALNNQDYGGFQRAYSRCKGIIEGREWAYIKPSITFKRIKDARTLIFNKQTDLGRVGRMTTDAKLMQASHSRSIAVSRVYEGDLLIFLPGDKKDWLGVLQVNGKIAFVKTSDCEVAQFVWTRN